VPAPLEPRPRVLPAGDAHQREKVVDPGCGRGDDAKRLALQETALLPRDSLQGVMFFKIKEDEEDRYFIIRKLFREGTMKIYIGITNVETGERIYFDLYL